MMKRLATGYFLLNKRLFKKYSFLLVLCLVPLFTGAIRLLAQEESGIVKIVLCLPDSDDEWSSEIVGKLTDKDSVFSYTICEDEKTARQMVIDYQADAAWIFPDNLEQSIRQTASYGYAEPVVTVVEREDTVTLMFTREVLCSALYSSFSYAVYENFVRKNLEMEYLTAEELREAYERTFVRGTLFQMAYLDGHTEEEENRYNYIQAPVRGMLAVWLVFCGFVASFYYMHDEQAGVFERVPVRRRLWAAFGHHAVLLSDAVIVFVIACKLSGVFTSWGREIVSAVLLTCTALVFCNLFRLMCRTPERLGSCMTILVVGMMVVCPIFIDIRQFGAVRYFLPPAYYLESIHSVRALYRMALYTVILAALCILLSKWQNRRT